VRVPWDKLYKTSNDTAFGTNGSVATRVPSVLMEMERFPPKSAIAIIV
jgi:hypothetical protein